MTHHSLPRLLPPLVDHEKLLAADLPELVRLLTAIKREVAENKVALGKLTDACLAVAVELRREREHPTAQRAERPRVGEKFMPRP